MTEPLWESVINAAVILLGIKSAWDMGKHFLENTVVAFRSRLRGLWDVYFYRYVVLDPLETLSLVLGIVIAIIGFLIRLGWREKAPEVASWLLILSGAGFILRWLLRQAQRPRVENDKTATRLNRARVLDNLEPSPANDVDNFQILQQPGIESCSILYSEKFNEFLRDNDVRLTVDPDAATRVKEWLQKRKKQLIPILLFQHAYSVREEKEFVNESKIGISSPIHIGVKEVSIFRGDYFTSWLTNELWERSFRELEGNESRKFYVGDAEFVTAAPGGKFRIQEFGQYAFGNHAGANTLGITKDGFLQLWLQSTKAQFSESTLAPTGSGSCDWCDLSNGSLKETIVKGMEREFREESIRQHRRVDPNQRLIEKTMIIGYFRNVYRGGLPGFLGISKLAVSAAQLEPDGREVKHAQGKTKPISVQKFSDLEAVVDMLLASGRNLRPDGPTEGQGVESLSVPLWANLLALRHLIRENPEIVRSFFGYQ